MTSADTRSQKYPVGIDSVSMAEIERRVPAGEAPPLPPNAQLAVIGKSIPRINGRAKVTGAAPFTVDVKLPGMLSARLLRSPLPHARVMSIDIGAAERHPGVRAIHVINDVVGRAVETTGQNTPAGTSGRRVLYVGDPIAAVAAVTPEAAQAAVDLIKVDYQPLAFVVDLEDARKPDAPRVFTHPVHGESFAGGNPAGAALPQQGNVLGPNKSGSRGDAAAGFADAAVVVEHEFRTQVQTHCCLEPHGLVADWRKDGLTVHMSTQFTAGIRAELAAAFGLPLSRVRVIVGARRNGALTAIAIDAYGTSGVGLGAGIGNFAQAIYDCANFELLQSDVFINAGPGCAMRAPGNVPGSFALEQTIDELAEKLGMDPLTLRERIDLSAVRREERRIGAARFGWNRRRAPGSDSGPIKRGLGMAQSLWGANVRTNSACEVRIFRDGSVEVLSSVQDIGTGIGTVLAQVVAEELGLRPEDITVRIGDTEYPAGPPSYGSLTTASITPPARNAAYQVLRKLIEIVAPSIAAAAGNLVARAGRISTADNSRSIGFREAAAQLPTDQIGVVASRSDDYAGFARKMGDMASAQNALGGVQFAEVAVDTETGIVRVERVVAVQDCGRPMNPLQIESQVQGGILQGISYALFEERILDRHTGHMLNANLEQYKILRSRETPAIEVHLLENYQGMSATDAYGIAEPSNIATAPAIANAVYNAIGVRLRQLPMSPAAVLAALGRIPQRSGPT